MEGISLVLNLSTPAHLRDSASLHSLQWGQSESIPQGALIHHPRSCAPALCSAPLHCWLQSSLRLHAALKSAATLHTEKSQPHELQRYLTVLINLFLLNFRERGREGGKERKKKRKTERSTTICCSTPPCIHREIPECALTGDQADVQPTKPPGKEQQCSFKRLKKKG